MKFIIVGHGAFAKGLASSVELITGDIERLTSISFKEDTEQLTAEIKEVMSEDEFNLFFTDLAGGTPFNVCGTLSEEYGNAAVISGTNLPMLLTAMFTPADSIDEFIKIVKEEGTNGIKQFEIKEKEDEVPEDGI